MGIQIIGNDIEIDGEKVARVLDIKGSIQYQLESYIEKADRFDDVETERDTVKEENKELADRAQEAYDDGHSDGYTEGKSDASSN